MKTREEIDKYLENIQFLSPNEPITEQGIKRVLKQIQQAVSDLEEIVGRFGKTISLWNPNMVYNKDDVVLYFKTENKQISPDVGKREFAFILVSTKKDNTSIPNYDMVDGIPDFTKTNWKLINPMSYLLQDLIGMKKVVKEVFQGILDRHVEDEHGIIGASDIQNNLVKTDYSNLATSWNIGDYSLNILDNGNMKKSSNGIMEYTIAYSFDTKANQQILIKDRKYYYQKSPIWDESDQTIFSSKYIEDNTFSVVVNQRKEVDENGNEIMKYVQFNNLRYGTNIFNAQIEFPEPFINDEYMVFFDTYEPGSFVFGYERHDLMDKEEPTWDAVVSRPMLLNKTASGFDIVLPIHTHFNSMQKYNIGVPWNNKFRLQVIGRYK